ncbi:hypothetical protein [Agathobacter ruminis]|uniref:Uncharacterized protein n=1 Tax=Agathobacter ruminis TaxID=1712665 RepID=A0A2G3E3L8_9FIRM|nr:hypothetical protein [Agathobacter ruminis]MDC7300785.1 hypothetical protein [Agathobacter ruminis]PHU37849.1 hypothetical protein CSX02_05750 [Agathobacter ruminis]
MEKKQVGGQLSLFDYINSIQNTEDYGNVEMVSLMPEPKFDPSLEIIDLNDEPEVTEPDEVKTEAEKPQESTTKTENADSTPVMSKYFVDRQGNVGFVEYWNYNNIRVQYPGDECIAKQFDNSKEAVDYYIETMYQMMDDKGLKEKM